MVQGETEMRFRLRLLSVAVCGVIVGIPGTAGAVTLEEAIQQTLATNPQILTTTNERLSRDEEIKQARAGYFPKVDVSAGIGREWSDNANTAPDDKWLTRKEAAINLRQMVFDGFATRSEVQRQEARVNSAAYTVAGTAQNTGLRTTEAYLELLRQQDLLKLAEDNLAAHQRIHDQIRLRSESGVGRTADLDQVEGRLARADANVVAARNNVKEAEAAYIRVVGAPPEALERPVGAEAVLPSTVEQAISSGLNNHPTLKSSLADVDAALAQHEASKHAFYPRFDIEVGRTWNEDWDGREGEDEDFTAMLRMRWNLFNGGADTARKQQTAHLINEAKEISNNTQRQVEESLRLSWTAYQSTKEQRDYLQKHVDATKRTREAYTKQFNIGQRTLLDVLDTENEVFEASRAFVTADYTNLFAQYRMLVGMGTFFETLQIEPPAESIPLAANTSAE